MNDLEFGNTIIMGCVHEPNSQQQQQPEPEVLADAAAAADC